MRRLGKDLQVSDVGLGCMGFTHAYGDPMDDQEGIASIRQALDLGYTFFDTAEFYTGVREDGSTAHNEDLVGTALKPYRNQIVLATKFGIKEGMVLDSSPEAIRHSVEGSLKRLQTDHIDLYYQHRIDPKVEPEEVAYQMGRLIQEGKITHWGISEVGADYIRRAHAVTPVTAIQNRFSMMSREDEDLFPVLAELNVGYVAYSPLANGFLSDAYQKGQSFSETDYRSFLGQYSDENFDANQALLAYIRQLAAEHNASPAQISLAWMLGKYDFIVPIPGSRKISRMKENFDASAIKLSSQEIAAIDQRLDQIEVKGVRPADHAK